MYDCGSRGNVTNTNGGVNANIATSMINNVIQTTGSNESYLTSTTSAVQCGNFSGSNNDWFAGGSSPCASNLTSNLSVNPLFASLTGTISLLLPSTSPLLGAGSSSSMPTYDITGLRRSSPPSVGAYEFKAGTAPVKPNPPTSLKVVVN
jgi:hypothetical protein